MSVTLMDYRHYGNKGFYGYRLYISKKPYYCIQKYYSFKLKGKYVSKKVQKLIYQQALEDEAEIIEKHGAVRMGSIFRKHKGGGLQGNRQIETPSRISGLNFNISSVRPEHTQNIDWEAKGSGKHYDVQFHTYKPFIVIWRGSVKGKSFLFRFCDKNEYFDQYKAAAAKYIELFDVSDEEADLIHQYQPPWFEVRDFLLAEVIRLYGVRPMGLSKI